MAITTKTIAAATAEKVTTKTATAAAAALTTKAATTASSSTKAANSNNNKALTTTKALAKTTAAATTATAKAITKSNKYSSSNSNNKKKTSVKLKANIMQDAGIVTQLREYEAWDRAKPERDRLRMGEGGPGGQSDGSDADTVISPAHLMLLWVIFAAGGFAAAISFLYEKVKGRGRQTNLSYSYFERL